MRCPWCDSDVVVPSERHITIDRGKVFDAPVPATECTACGRIFARGNADVERAGEKPEPRD